MAFTPINPEEVESGEPVKAQTHDTVRTNLDDLDARLRAAELGVSTFPPVYMTVNGPYASGSAINDVLRQGIRFGMNIKGVRILIKKAGQSGTTDIDLKVSREGGPYTSIFSDTPKAPASGGNDYLSDSGEIAEDMNILLAGDVLRLDQLESQQSSGLGNAAETYQVIIDWDRSGIPAEDETAIFITGVDDTNSISLTVDGSILSANVKMSAEEPPTNFSEVELIVENDGLRAQLDDQIVRDILNPIDSMSIDLGFALGALEASLNLSSDTPDPGYITTELSINPDGLKAQTPIMVGDTGSGGVSGVVPAPAPGDAGTNKFLHADGTWQVVPDSSAFIGAVVDTDTVDMLVDGGTLSAEVRISEAAANEGMINVDVTIDSTEGTPGLHLQVPEMRGATDSLDGSAGVVPKPLIADKLKYLRGDGTWQEVEAGSGEGGINYITNGNAKDGTTDDWSESGSGFTIDVNSTNPLLESVSPNDFILEKDASNRQTRTISTDFTIDTAFLSSVLRGTFLYNTNTNYVTGDVNVYVYDVDASVIIPVVNKQLRASTLTKEHIFEFQTNASSVNYRLIFEVMTTSALSYAVRMAAVSVGPREVSVGPVITDAVSVLSTLQTSGGGDITLNTGTSYQQPRLTWSQLGERLVGYGVFRNGTGGAGSGTAGEVQFLLPSGLAYDVTKMNGTTVNSMDGVIGEFSSGSSTEGVVIAKAGYISFLKDDGSVMSVSDLSSGYSCQFKVSIPILGWSSGSKMSSMFSNRSIFARYTHSAGSTYSSGDIINFANQGTDETNAVTTGASWRFTAQEDMNIDVSSVCFTTSSITNSNYFQISLYRNGSLFAAGTRVTQTNTGANVCSQVTTTVPMLRGDYIDIRNDSAASRQLLSNGNYNYISITKRSTPQTLLGTTNFHESYAGSSTSIGTSPTTAIFTTKVNSTHGAYNVSTGETTIPFDDVYTIDASVQSSGSASGTALVYMTVFVNGSSRKVIAMNTSSNGIGMGCAGSCTIPLAEGDVVTIRPAFQVTQTLFNNSAATWFSIKN